MSTTSRRDGSGTTERPRPRAAKLPRWPELRHVELQAVEVRSLKENGEMVEVTGTPITCRSYTVPDPLGDFRETIAPEAVAKVLSRNPQTRLLIGHNQGSIPLAKSPTTLHLRQGTDGSLQFSADLDMKRQDVNDLVSALKRRDISGLSIGFQCRQDSWRDGTDGVEERTVTDIELHEFSFVAFPCDSQTSAEVVARMGFGASIESRARLRRMIADARAGKPLTAQQQLALSAFADGLDIPDDDHELVERIRDQGAAVRTNMTRVKIANRLANEPPSYRDLRRSMKRARRRGI